MKVRFLKMVGNKGFSLVELMVVVAIIGILATIAMPRYKQFSAKAKQSEAKTSLSNLHALMESYRAENDTFPMLTTSDLNLTLVGYNQATAGSNNVRYTVSLNGTPAQNAFTGQADAAAGALGNGCSADQWRIFEDRRMINSTVFSCSN